MDIESAYDCILREYVFHVLDRLGFGPIFLGMLGTLYSKLEAQVLFKGEEGGSFEMTNGLGQGDPLSPLLFAVAMLPLSKAINRTCTAYSSGRQEVELPPPNKCFADDVVACINYSPENIRKYLEVFEEFGRVANLTIAMDKSTIALSKEKKLKSMTF